MNPECRKAFSQLHALLSKRQFRALEGRLIDNRTGRVRAPFRCDLNHAWYLSGESFSSRSRWQNAIQAYRKAYARDRTDWQALMAIGNCYDRLRRPRDAARYLSRAASIFPRSAKLQYNLGNALFDMGRLPDALRCYRKAQRGSGSSQVKRMAARNEERARALIDSARDGASK